MIVKVTQYHISRGKRWTACVCPVALAIEDATGRKAAVNLVHIGTFVQTGDVIDDWRQLDTPEPVKEFIRRFDAGATCEPFEFEMEV